MKIEIPTIPLISICTGSGLNQKYTDLLVSYLNCSKVFKLNTFEKDSLMNNFLVLAIGLSNSAFSFRCVALVCHVGLWLPCSYISCRGWWIICL